MLFPPISRKVMFGRPSKPSGIDPFRKLFLSRSFERLWQFPRSSGIGPISSFPFRMTISSFWPAQRSCGIVPLRKFEERSSIVRFMFCPSVAGMLPVNLFCQRFSTWCRHKAQCQLKSGCCEASSCWIREGDLDILQHCRSVRKSVPKKFVKSRSVVYHLPVEIWCLGKESVEDSNAYKILGFNVFVQFSLSSEVRIRYWNKHSNLWKVRPTCKFGRSPRKLGMPPSNLLFIRFSSSSFWRYTKAAGITPLSML